MTTGDNKQQKQVVDDEGSDKEGGKGVATVMRVVGEQRR